MKITKYIVVLSTILFSVNNYAQKIWSLDDCVTYAIEHNLQLGDFNYTMESKEEDRKQAFRALLPSIRATSGYTVRFGRSVNPNDNTITTNTRFFSNDYDYTN